VTLVKFKVMPKRYILCSYHEGESHRVRIVGKNNTDD
jgi:hypothetical protein